MEEGNAWRIEDCRTVDVKIDKWINRLLGNRIPPNDALNVPDGMKVCAINRSREKFLEHGAFFPTF